MRVQAQYVPFPGGQRWLVVFRQPALGRVSSVEFAIGFPCGGESGAGDGLALCRASYGLRELFDDVIFGYQALCARLDRVLPIWIKVIGGDAHQADRRSAPTDSGAYVRAGDASQGHVDDQHVGSRAVGHAALQCHRRGRGAPDDVEPRGETARHHGYGVEGERIVVQHPDGDGMRVR